MRVKSGDGLDAVAFPTADSSLVPTGEFLPLGKKEHSNGMSKSGFGGRTPDEMLKAYAAAMGNNEKGGPEKSAGTGIVASLKKLTGIWRK